MPTAQALEAFETSTLTDFQQNPAAYLNRAKQTGQPVKLTVNGQVEAVLLDAASFQKLLDALDYADAVEGIRRGLADIEAGRTRPAAEFLAELQQKYNLPAKP